jgi:hypothetical protein
MNAALHIVIEAGRNEANYWPDLFRHCEPFYFWRGGDVMVATTKPRIGILWASGRRF